jgi:hypothetical protein
MLVKLTPIWQDTKSTLQQMNHFKLLSLFQDCIFLHLWTRFGEEIRYYVNFVC